MHHADCGQCCQIGRCHFCGGVGKVVAHFEKPSEMDGVPSQRYEVRLCPTHFSWAASNARAPAMIFDESFLSETPSEPLRKSESFQSAVLAAATR